MNINGLNRYGSYMAPPGARVMIEMDENETASFLPTAYMPTKPNLKLPVSKLRNIVYQIKDPARFVEVVNQFKVDIADHMEMKIQTFFYQLALTYGIGLKLFYDRAYFQAGIINKKSNDKSTVLNPIKPVETHCPTFPTLLAIDKKAFKDCFLVEDKPMKRIFLAKGSSFAKDWNMVTILPACANEADSDLEWKLKLERYARMTFRECTHNLLKYSSKGKLNPESGIKNYLEKAENYLLSLSKQAKPDYMLRIYEIYLDVIGKYQKLIKKPETFRKLTFSVTDYTKLQGRMVTLMQHQIRVQNVFELTASTIQNRFNIEDSEKKHLRIVTKMVMLLRTKSLQTLLLEQLIAKEDVFSTTTIEKHISSCIQSEEIKQQLVTYIQGRTVLQLENDMTRGITEKPFLAIVNTIVQYLNVNFKNKKYIVMCALYRISIHHTATPEIGLLFRQHLCLNDAMVEEFSEGHPKRRKLARSACSHADIQTMLSIQGAGKFTFIS